MITILRSKKILSLFLFAIFTHGSAFADYYSGSGKGWWWYDREQPVKEEKEMIKPSIPEPATPEKTPKNDRNTSLYNYTYEEVWEMHPDDFYDVQESIKKRAVQKPTEANVKEYYEAQEIARKKALAFTNTSMLVWQKYPELSTVKDFPSNTPGNLTKVGLTVNEKMETLKNNKANFALIYFKRANCRYCIEQNKILDWFKSHSGWTIKTIDTGESPGISSKFSIDIVPSLILVQKGNQDFFPVSSGVATAEEIEEKTYRAIKILNKQTVPEDFSIYEHQRNGGYDIRKKPKDWGKLR